MLDKVDYFIVNNMYDVLLPQVVGNLQSPNRESDNENKIINVSRKDFFFSECSSLQDLCTSLRSVSLFTDKFYDVDNILISTKLKKMENSGEGVDGSLPSYNSSLNSSSIKNTHRG